MLKISYKMRFFVLVILLNCNFYIQAQNSSYSFTKDTSVINLIIDFGNTSVYTLDGKKHTGSIRAKVSGDYMNTSGSIDAIFHNYFVNEDELKGKLIFSNLGGTSEPAFDVESIDFEVNDETIINYDLELQWQAGYSTTDVLDDIMALSGSVIGGDSVNSKDFTVDILTPLHLNGACSSVIESGELEITLLNDEIVPIITIDFILNDGCNNLFQATVDCQGNPLSFTFPLD